MASGLLLQTKPAGFWHAGPTGLALSPAGALYFVTSDQYLYKTSVTGLCPAGPLSLDSGPCNNGVEDGEETDVDCGGRVCRRCGLGASCSLDTDCASGFCTAAGCEPPIPTPAPTGLAGYLSSETYEQSFMHHMAHGDMGGASYLNPYPLMEPHFCDTVGTFNQSGVGPVDCNRIDFDALLLGGCWCHECLPENPCGNGGVCVNFNKQGYKCDCTGTGYGGDHCTTVLPWANCSSADLAGDFNGVRRAAMDVRIDCLTPPPPPPPGRRCQWVHAQ